MTFSVLETYITHIRITEYASYPTAPPPLEVRGTQAEKPRIIIVAVRKSGRVRIHKSKENANGTFSIGKTWDLNDMTSIESFTSSSVDPLKRECAGDTGFIVHIGKPYYWQARADKEKKFFVASLIKIYGKYTGGNVPELIGFDPREIEQVLGSRRPPPGRPPPNEATPPPRQGLATMSSQGNLRSTGSPGEIRAYQPPNARALAPPNGASSPASSIESSRMGSQPAPLRRLAPNNASQDSVAASISTTRSDDTGMRRPPSRGNDTGSRPPRSRGGDAGSRPPPRLRGEDAGSVPPRSRGGDTGSRPPPRSRGNDTDVVPPRSRGGPGGSGGFGKLEDSPNVPPLLDLPDRKRPPMDPARPQGMTDNDLVPAPLMSPAFRREPPPRSSDRMSPRKPPPGQRSEITFGKEIPPPIPFTPPQSSVPELAPAVNEPPLDPTHEAKAELKSTPDSIKRPSADASVYDTPTATAASTPPAETPTEPPTEDDARPGLGPMIKAKGQRDIAGALWKAASAAAAFKPRPGGAGERLREVTKKPSSEPDGITGVVPAPPRPTFAPEPVPPPEPVRPREADEHPHVVPEVKVTVPNSSRPTSLQASVKEAKRKSLEPPRKEDKPEQLIVTGNDAKYLAALGVDMSLLADTTPQFAGWLDHFGWVPGEKMRNRNTEEMKIDIERELNKAQAGGWIARFQDEDERVDAIKKGLDVAITECEELDNLLTLYTVELSVSGNLKVHK